jgi:hypothetical protein
MNNRIPASVRSIENCAFHCCAALKEIDLPNSLTSISLRAFAHCKALKRIVVPNSVMEIQYNTFYNCSSLATVRLPKNCNLTISNDAFANCNAFRALELPRMKLAVLPHFLEQFNSNRRLFARIGLSDVARKTCAFSFLRQSAPQLFEDRKLPGVVRQQVKEEATT